jgi:uncharacterized membrane protein YgdD (TMEM256/DUF423 family)
MQTGENDQAMRRILDMTRLISIGILVIHFYAGCYGAFAAWHLTAQLSDRLLSNIARTGLVSSFVKPKLISLIFLTIALIGVQGKKDENKTFKMALSYMVVGLLFFFTSGAILPLSGEIQLRAWAYMTVTGLGYLVFLSGGTMLSRIIRVRLSGDIFNRDNETFPQEERLLWNEYSVNLPTRYRLKGQWRSGWLNIINPFRSVLVTGGAGSGKSYFVIRHLITQHISKGFAMMVYDFKFDDLSKIVYHTFLKYRHLYPAGTRCVFINFDRLLNRCNPLEPQTMFDITDAVESARTILIGLNREWNRRQGEFFVESPINLLTAVIWFLRRYKDGEFCTVPHAIEMIQLEYDQLFTVLRTEPEVDALINPFISAYLRDAIEQLEGQIASAKVTLARLSSPQLYFVLSGSDFTLDINNPDEPKLLCIGNNPQKIQIYGAVISLYINRLIKLVNQKGRRKCSLVFDELPTVDINNIDVLIATARSNKVSTCLGIQDFSQLRKDYGRERADVIMNSVGNIIAGQSTGDTAKNISDRIGRVMQDRESLSINRSDTSISRSKQLEAAVPPSRIAALSSGEFTGILADNPDCKIELKAFHCEIINDHDALNREIAGYGEIPEVEPVDAALVQRNYLKIKADVQGLVQEVIERLLSDPALSYLVIRKNG